jgi:serine/threonine-protein kinase
VLDQDQAVAEAERALGLAGVTPFARGGQKVVARATRRGEPVVLKVVLLNTTAADPNALERCEREVALLKELDAPNIVKLESDMVALGSGPDAAAWLEEELDGTDLAALLGPPWPWADLTDMLVGIGTGLSVMHNNGYVHRDLSPNNIRKTASGAWKVMDPGFAKHLKRTSITGLYQPGTPGYMSPEHAVAGGRVSPASDVFCLGILGYRALTGSLPIPVGGDLNDYGRRLRGAQSPSVRVARPDLTADQAAIIDTCLARQPARRFLDAEELVSEVGTTAPGGQP